MLKISKMNLILISSLILIFGSNLNAQENEKLLPRFDYEVVSFPGREFQDARTHVYVWVRNTHLQFVTMDSVYSARYQINIGVENKKGASVLTEDKTYSVSERSYAVTIDPKAQRIHRYEILLPPGEYTCQEYRFL